MLDTMYISYEQVRLNEANTIIKTFILDDFYTLKNRDKNGNLQENRTRFPAGMYVEGLFEE